MAPVVVSLQFDAVFGVVRALGHGHVLQVGHQRVDGGLELLDVQRLHLLEHELGHQLAVALHLGHFLHPTVQLAPNRRRLLVRRVQLPRKITFRLRGGGRSGGRSPAGR